MIVFDLACPQGHAFEGWFDSADAYAGQHARGLVRCPVCDDARIDKRLSARVNTLASKASRQAGAKAGGRASDAAKTPASAGESAEQSQQAAAQAQAASQAQAAAHAQAMQAMAGLPPEILAKLREVVRSTENVGERFAEEARKIHYEEVPARAIRGKATPDEAEALREEGIDFAPLPPDLTSETH